MLRSLAIVLAIAVGLMPPAIAQQLTEQEAWGIGKKKLDEYNRACQAKDVAGVGARYTEDAILVGSVGFFAGRAAIEKRYADSYKNYTCNPSILEKVVVISNDVIWFAGSWSGTYQGTNIKGYWSTTNVRDGDMWKIRTETNNTTPAN
jgi:ketosteroid isomerase-like protein